MTLARATFGTFMGKPMILAMTSTGGVLLLGLGLVLLELKEIRVANMLPALVVAPLLAAAAPLWPLQASCGVIFLAFLPQFVNLRTSGAALRLVLLGRIFVLLSVIAFGVIALFSGFLGDRLSKTPVSLTPSTADAVKGRSS